MGSSWLHLVAFALVCCSACSACPGDDRAASGPYAYTPCLNLPVTADEIVQLPGLTLRLDERTLQVDGLEGPVRIAAFAGPAPGRFTDELQVLAGSQAQLAIMLGGAGDAPATVGETFAALSGLPFPTLILPGGRDRLALLAQARAELPPGRREQVVLLSGVRRVIIGSHEFIVLPGVEGGRYGVDQQVCGFGAAELATLASSLPEPEARTTRWLLSWSAPGGGGPLAVGRTHSGLDVGSGAVAAFAHKVGAVGGMFAWPAVRAMQPVQGWGKRPVVPGNGVGDLQVTVPRLGGPALERSDGSRVPSGIALLQIAEGTVQWLAPRWGAAVGALDTKEGT